MQILTRLIAIRARIASLPLAFRWTRGMVGAARTLPGTLTEIGDRFSLRHGPNGRAAVLIHEAVHFTEGPGANVDVPEWSGATINGVFQGIPQQDPNNPGLLMAIPYASLTTAQAIENPSSYASFAQEVFFGVDNRFGEARPHE